MNQETMMFRLRNSRITSQKALEFSVSPYAWCLSYCRRPLTILMLGMQSQDKPSRRHLTTDFAKAVPACSAWLSPCCFVSQKLSALRAGTAWAVPSPQWQYFILAPTPCFGGPGHCFTRALTRAFLQPADMAWVCSLLPEKSPHVLHGFPD